MSRIFSDRETRRRRFGAGISVAAAQALELATKPPPYTGPAIYREDIDTILVHLSRLLSPAERKAEPILNTVPTPVTVCMAAVSKATNISCGDIVSERRSRAVSRARMMVCWVARHATPYSLPRIGACLGGLDHTSVMHGISRIDELRQSVPFIRDASDAALRAVTVSDPRQAESAI